MIDIGSRKADIFNIMIMIFNLTLACQTSSSEDQLLRRMQSEGLCKEPAGHPSPLHYSSATHFTPFDYFSSHL